MADKGYRSASFEEDLNEAHMTLIRPATKTEAPRSGQRFLRPFRQIIESIFQTFKGQLDLERHGGRTKAGVVARVLQPILALTTVIWHNETTQRPGPARSLIAYDHQNLGTNHLGGNIGDVGEPQPVRTLRLELAIHKVSGSGRILVWDGRTLFSPLTTPFRPSWRISRSTVQRATATPSRCSWRHTLRAPYIPNLALPNTADMGRNSLSRRHRADLRSGSRSRRLCS